MKINHPLLKTMPAIFTMLVLVVFSFDTYAMPAGGGGGTPCTIGAANNLGTMNGGDDCFAAANIGTLATPCACDGSAITPLSVDGTTVGALAEAPYIYQTACQGAGGDAYNPAADVWYTVDVNGPELQVDITSSMSGVSVSIWVDDGTGCGGLIARGCSNSGNGNLSDLFTNVQTGETVYIQVSGTSDTDVGDFTLEVAGTRSCTACILADNLTVSPAPINGTYQGGETVSFCYSITEYDQVNTNWMSGVAPVFAAGWNVGSLTPFTLTTCQGGTGSWIWETVSTPSDGNLSGFFFDSDNNGTTANNFGDNCTGTAADWTFCWDITTVDCVESADLGIEIYNYSDGEVGSWTDIACENDPNYTFSAVLTCCPLPTAVVDQHINCGVLGEATVTGNGSSPWEYDFGDANHNSFEVQSNVMGSATVTGLTNPGIYYVTVTDNNACETYISFTILGTPALVITASGTDPTCAIPCDGAGTVSATGGDSNYTFNWSDGQTGTNASALCAGIFDVTVTDGTGCTEMTSITLTAPTPPTVAASMTADESCDGVCDGAVTAVPTGGQAPITYAWDNSAGTSQSPNSLCDNTYTVTITDALSCTAVDNAVVAPGPVITATITGALGNQCLVGNNFAFIGTTSTVSSGSITSYNWDFDDGNTSTSSTPNNTFAAAGTYNVTLTVSDGTCTDQAIVPVTIVANPTVVVTSPNPDCAMTSGQVTATPAGGTPGYTYIWSNAGTSQTENGLADGLYTVTVSDANTCSVIGSLSITQPPAMTLTQNCVDITAPSANDGSSAVAVAGGQSAYTYNWNTGATGSSINSLGAGLYTVTVTDANLCTSVSFCTVTEPNCTVTFASTVTNANCFGASDGSASIDMIGGAAPLVYNWSNGGTNGTEIGLPSGAINVTITDNNLCVLTGSVNVGQPTALLFAITSTDILCNGDANGTTDVSISGGTPGYTFNWSSGGTAEDLSGLNGGTYDVTVTDNSATGCTVTGSTTIAEPLALFASVSISDVSCAGANDGEANLTVSGGTTNYTYLWSNGATSEDLTGLSGGNANVTVTDANNCTFIVTSVVNEPTSVSITTVTTPANCGLSDGSATATGNGGSGAGYTYVWSNSVSTATITNLTAAAYNVTVADGAGCTATTTATVSNLTGGNVSITIVSPVSCFGGSDGIATVAVTGGTTPFIYNWSNGGNTATTTGLSAGAFSVTVTDGVACIMLDADVMTQPTDVTGFLTNVDVSCFGECDGSATANFIGGTTPYTYAWNNGQTAITNINLCADTAFVTITDANGCIELDSVKIQTPTLITVTTTTVNSNCNQADGSATVSNVQGGFSGYTYNWGGGNTGATLSGLVAAGYPVTVTDITGCTMIGTAVVSDAGGGAISVTVNNNVSCFGGSDGQATLTQTGGSGPFTYSWSTGGTGTVETGMSAGGFTVTMTDNVGCIAVASDVITAPTQLTAIANATPVSCNGGTNGTATVIGSGGTTGYTYNWNNGGGTSASATTLSPNTYSATVTDLMGCTATASTTVGEPTVLTSTVVGTNATCFGVADGSALLTVFGGTTGYSYAWSNTTAFQNLSGAGAGSYSVTITDNAGCTTTNAVSISEPGAVVASVPTTNNASCGGVCDGNATASVTGGTSPYTYLWDDAQSNPTAFNLCAGSIGVTVTDNNGCEGISSTLITEPTPVVGFISATNLSCFGAGDGSVGIAVTGGTTAYTYLWDNTGAVATLTGLAAGTYNVTVTDANGCSIIDIANITEPTELVLSNSTTQSTCGQSDGSATVTIITGDPGFTYLWDPTAGSQTTATASNIPAGNYQVTVTDGNGCTDISYPSVTDAGAPSVFILTVTDASCFNGTNGFAQISVAGGTPPYSYLWNTTPGQSTASATGLAAGTWSAVMTDDDGCIASINVNVDEPTQVNAAISTFTNVNCFGASDGTATVFAVGGTPGYTYQWNDVAAQTTAMATGLLPGIYQVAVNDLNSCNDIVSVTISEPVQILLSNSTVDAFCNTATGEACVIITQGGVGPYTYSWDNLQVNACAAALVPGNYTITLTDINGCTGTNTATVGNIPPGIATISNTTTASCNGMCDGTATVSMGAATAPYSYVWSNGATNITATGLCPITYNVTVTDANSCAAVTTVTIADPIALSATTGVTNANCKNGNEGDITAFPTGGTAPYSYLWDNATLAQTGQTASNLVASTYFVTITDVNGCTLVTSDAILEPNPILIDSTVTNSNCQQNDGSACASVSGGTAPYTYLWQTIETTSCIVNLYSGTYNLTVTDANFCEETISVIVSDIDGPTADIVDTLMVSCFGYNDGYATVDMIGGTGAFSAQWFDSFGIPIPAQVAPQANNLTAGNYSVDITDALGCVASAVVEIVEPSVLVNNPNSSDPSCFGYCDATAGATVGGGTTPYTYSWTGTVSTSNQVTNLCSGPYILSITDAQGCFNIVNYNVVEPAEILASITTTDVNCFNACNGTATVIPSNGIGGYTYEWDDTQSTPTAIGLCDQAYAVTVTDGNGCSVINSTTITQPSAVVASIAAFQNVSCADLCDGFVQANVTGGTPGAGYSFVWSNGQGSQTAVGLCNGQYIVTISDANGCTATASQVITQPTPVTAVMVNTIHVLCNGDASGAATVSAGGGVGGYTYLWDVGANFQASATANNLYASSSGAYFVTVTDANGCAETANVVITEPTPFGLNVDTTSSHCGQNDGQICVTPFGGIQPVTYQWNDPFTQTDACADFISAGCYTVIVTDGNGCIADSTICINDIAGPTVNLLSYSDVSCAGASDGVVNVNVTGGTPPYASITWANPTALPQFIGSSSALFVPGNLTYTMTVVDNAGCTANFAQFLYEPSAIVAFVTSSTNVLCFGGNNGAANVTTGGGTPSYTYSWNTTPVQTTAQATGLTAGIYTVIVSDANNCSNNAIVTISEPTQVVTTDVTTDALCHGICDGSAVLSTSQGTPPYLYTWSPLVSSNALANGLCDGSYNTTITDANGCTITNILSISEPDTLNVTFTTTDSYCSDANGTATLLTTGGTPGYSPYWITNPTQNTATAVGLMSGSYNAQVTDANGCLFAVNVPIADQPGPSISNITFTMPDCYNDPSGSACVNVTGGTAPLTYAWNDIVGQITQCATGLYARTYTVTVTDANGCTDIANGLLGQPSQLIATGIGDTTLCDGKSTIIWGVAQGGTTPYASIVWNDPTLIGFGPHTVSPATLTDYCFTITDAKGCTSSDCITIGRHPELLIIEPDDYVICFESEANFCVTGFGGTAINDYVFTWDDGTVDDSTTTSCRVVSPTDTTTYRVILSDGCSLNDTAWVTVDVLPLPPPYFSVLEQEGCPPFTAQFSGFTNSTDFPNATFEWEVDEDTTSFDSGEQFFDFIYENSGSYDVTLTVTSEHGCSRSITNLGYITVYPDPVANFTLYPDVVTLVSSDVFVNGEATTGTDSLSWDFGDGQSGLGITDTNTYGDTGVYYVTLTAVNEWGCRDIMTLPVIVEADFILYAPNAFTPNGDGTNDEFFPDGIGIDSDDFEMFIYDRWGEIIFKSNRLNDKWDGTAREKSGTKKVQEGVYVWLIIAKDFYGEEHRYMGHVTLLK